MKLLLALLLLSIGSVLHAQSDEKISSMDFVKILDGNIEEARYYYQNNWRVLRKIAREKGYIHSYEVLERSAADSGQYDLVLITTYANRAQFEKREDHFQEIIKERGGLKLLNDKEPAEFRETLYSEDLQHWE
ncbi:MAG: hypothetical protein HKN61_02340 [Flavobacteriaceae bacterium]|nr:hypothetical protein [Flavobacteriaceae bacterium]